MRTQSADTSPEAERVQIELLRLATVTRRFSLVRSLSQTTIQLARRAIRRLHPKADEKEILLFFVEAHYGRELADRLRVHLVKETQMNTPNIKAALTPLVESFEEIGIPYQIGGSVASSVYGLPRATLDVDLVVDLRLDQVRPLLQRLEADYYIDEDVVRGAVQRRSSFNLIHQATILKVDVFLIKSRPYDVEAFRRRRRDTLEEDPNAREFYLSSAEDIILNKLEWVSQGGCVSDRQWNDVLGVLKVQRQSLDLAYLRHWAAELGLTDLLERSFHDAG